MYNIERYVKTLELDNILELLSCEATLSDASEMAKGLVPQTDIESVKNDLKKTEDAYIFMSRYSAPSFGSATNVASPLLRGQSGGVLSMRELLDVAETLRVIRSLKDWRGNCSGVENTSIDYLFDTLVPNKYLEEKITFAI